MSFCVFKQKYNVERKKAMKKTRKGLACLLAVVMALTALPAGALAAEDNTDTNGVAYIDGNGDSQTCTDATAVTSSDTTWGGTDGQTKWYVVSSDVTIGSADSRSRITVTGSVSLILTDGCTLTINGGIEVLGGKSLTIYGQTNGTGKLICQNVVDNYAGIGGNAGTTVSGNVDGNCGQITIHGGTTEVTGGSSGAGIGCGHNGTGGTINVTGGTVTAQGGSNGAGIGHGSGAEKSFGTITISGGTVTAKGGFGGAGIGGKGCNITISGESTQITAQGGSSGAGIGGSSGDAGTITISGGKVDTTGGSGAAGIGGGDNGSGGSITISGGTVTAKGGTGGAGIGGGQYTGTNTTINITGGTVTVTGGGSNAADIGGGGTSSSGTLASQSITIGEGATVKTAEGGTPTLGPFHGVDTETWASDENNHWHPCMIANCNESSHQSGSAAHSYAASVNDSGTLVSACTTCGYVNESTYSGYSLNSITVTAQPNKLTYNGGEQLDLTGLAIKATYSNGTDNVEVSLSYNSTGVTCSPASGTALTTDEHNGEFITITIGSKSATTNQLTVNETTESSDLVEGNTYWFDLSSVGIPGTVNTNLPGGLSWVPFTYVGSINAYSLDSSSTDNTVTAYDHSLFIADYNVTQGASWDNLNTAELIFGKTYSSGGVNYELRAPSAQSNTSSEWDVILNKASQGGETGTTGYIKNWSQGFSWGQDTQMIDNQPYQVVRGSSSANATFYFSSSSKQIGYRPVLEIPADSTTTGLTTVTIDLNGGSIGTTTGTVELIVKSGQNYSVPSGWELTPPDGKAFAGWKGSNGNLYSVIASIPADVTSLTALWLDKPIITKQPESATYYVGDTAEPLTVEASVTSGATLGYRWFRASKDDYSDFEEIQGTIDSTTYTPTTATAGTTYYFCLVLYIDGDVGSTTIYSDLAVVTVLEKGEGYTIDYEKETIKADDGYELAESSDAETGTTDSIAVTPKTSLCIRRAKTETVGASNWMEVTIPDRPAAPKGITGGYEKLTGVTTAMQYSTDGTNWTDITGTEVTGLSAGTYYVRYKATGTDFASYATNAVTVQADKTPPTGTITVKENKWSSFINIITFGTFCKDKYDVTIMATDNETGVASVEYLLSETMISTKDIIKQTGWQTYSTPGFSIENDGKYIIYAKITDNSNNIAYISTNGMILDKGSPSKPTVSGYTSGTWTNGDVTLTVSGATALSGIAKYEYSTNGGASWNEMTVTVKTEASDTAPANVVKAQLTVSRATDTAYLIRAVSNTGAYSENVSVIVKIETTAPTIEGIANGETYCPNHTFTVSDDNLKEVKIGGAVAQAENGVYTLTAEGTYSVTATDEAGNSVTYTVTVGHNWNDTTYEWSEDGKTCTATRICKNDSAHIETATATVTGTQTKAPTCTEPGETTYTAAFAEAWAESKNTIRADIPAAGHSYEHHDAVSPECEQSGMEEHYTCKNCDLIFDKDKNATTPDDLTINATGHTFSAEWKTNGEKHWHECSCGAKTGESAHTFEWEIDKEAQVGVAGSKHEECTECGYAKAVVEIPALKAPEYPPVIDGSDGGKVTVNPENPQAGDEVMITPKPESGKMVDKVIVTDENGKEIAVTDNGDGIYTFTQPDGKVTVKVTFKTEESKPSTDEKSTQTGDNSNMWLWLAILFVSGGGAIGTTIYGIKKKHGIK